MHSSQTGADPNQNLLGLLAAIRADWRAGVASLAPGSTSVLRKLEELNQQLARQDRASLAVVIGFGGLYSAFACYGVLAAFGII